MHPIPSFFGTCCIEKGCQGKGKTLHDYFEKGEFVILVIIY